MATCIWKGRRIVQLGPRVFELTNGRRFESVAAAKAYIDAHPSKAWREDKENVEGLQKYLADLNKR